MTTVPQKLVLMGDNFESDPMIYATIALLLVENREARQIWQDVSTRPEFQFTSQQNGQILGKLYQLESMKQQQCEVQIYIRKLHEQQSCNLDDTLFGSVKHLISFYA